MSDVQYVFRRSEEFNLPKAGFKSYVFRASKLGFDKLTALFCLPIIALVALVIAVLNRRYNPGPLFFTQKRMGKHGKPFKMVKFRSMLPAGEQVRGHTDGVETSRITPLGKFLRTYRIDELPNMINVLRHEMSIIGPRPDAWDHAVAFCQEVPGYRTRHRVLPGITGLAQTRMGYAQGVDETAVKTRLDRLYIRHQGFRSELGIIWGTIRVILSGFGAR